MENISEILKSLRKEAEENPMTNEEFMQFQVDCYNEEEGHLNQEDGIECELCKNKGWIQYIRDGYVMTRQCYCEAKRKTYRRAKRSGLGEYLKKTLDDYQTNAPWQETLKGITKEFITNHSQDGVWMMACGQSGSGKTLLCSIVANHLLFNEAREVMYVTWTDFISKLKRDMMGDKTNKVSEYLEEVKKCEVLFLDETLKKYNETDLKYLIEIINYRYTNDLKTIITSERVLDELLDIDEATFGRAVEKCEGYLMNIPKDRCKNYRLRAVTV